MPVTTWEERGLRKKIVGSPLFEGLRRCFEGIEKENLLELFF